jgi:hypothetical protein
MHDGVRFGAFEQPILSFEGPFNHFEWPVSRCRVRLKPDERLSALRFFLRQEAEILCAYHTP